MWVKLWIRGLETAWNLACDQALDVQAAARQVAAAKAQAVADQAATLEEKKAVLADLEEKHFELQELMKKVRSGCNMY